MQSDRLFLIGQSPSLHYNACSYGRYGEFAGRANKRITVNLAPADLRKEGPAHDLPIAISILAASEQVWPDKLDGAMAVGELSLDGGVRHTKGVLPMAALARQEGIHCALVPAVNAEEAALMTDVEVLPVPDLSEWAT